MGFWPKVHVATSFLALALLHEKRFLGVNLTVPHKIIAFGLPEVAVTPAAASDQIHEILGVSPPSGRGGSRTTGSG